MRLRHFTTSNQTETDSLAKILLIVTPPPSSVFQKQLFQTEKLALESNEILLAAHFDGMSLEWPVGDHWIVAEGRWQAILLNFSCKYVGSSFYGL
mmetsp:Transcript_55828/g.135247  ORF Transcript_55828/g.135247 Transcript_55828/m.135247 type:complete len:95 (+) Transcript_55828:1137-1421(+)